MPRATATEQPVTLATPEKPMVAEPLVNQKVVEIENHEQREKVVEVPKTEPLIQDRFVDYVVPIDVQRPVSKEVVDENIHVVPRTVEKEVLVDVPEVQVTEKIVEIPEIIKEERVIQVPKIVKRERKVPRTKIVDIEKIVEVPEVKQVEKIVEKIVEVPEIKEEEVIKEVEVEVKRPRPVPVERIVEVPVNKVVTRDVPVEVIQYREVPRAVEVEVIRYRDVPREVILEKPTPVAREIKKFVDIPKIVKKENLINLPVAVTGSAKAVESQVAVEISAADAVLVQHAMVDEKLASSSRAGKMAKHRVANGEPLNDVEHQIAMTAQSLPSHPDVIAFQNKIKEAEEAHFLRMQHFQAQHDDYVKTQREAILGIEMGGEIQKNSKETLVEVVKAETTDFGLKHDMATKNNSQLTNDNARVVAGTTEKREGKANAVPAMAPAVDTPFNKGSSSKKSRSNRR